MDFTKLGKGDLLCVTKDGFEVAVIGGCYALEYAKGKFSYLKDGDEPEGPQHIWYNQLLQLYLRLEEVLTSLGSPEDGLRLLVQTLLCILLHSLYDDKTTVFVRGMQERSSRRSGVCIGNGVKPVFYAGGFGGIRIYVRGGSQNLHLSKYLPFLLSNIRIEGTSAYPMEIFCGRHPVLLELVAGMEIELSEGRLKDMATRRFYSFGEYHVTHTSLIKNKLLTRQHLASVGSDPLTTLSVAFCHQFGRPSSRVLDLDRDSRISKTTYCFRGWSSLTCVLGVGSGSCPDDSLGFNSVTPLSQRVNPCDPMEEILGGAPGDVCLLGLDLGPILFGNLLPALPVVAGCTCSGFLFDPGMLSTLGDLPSYLRIPSYPPLSEWESAFLESGFKLNSLIPVLRCDSALVDHWLSFSYRTTLARLTSRELLQLSFCYLGIFSRNDVIPSYSSLPIQDETMLSAEDYAAMLVGMGYRFPSAPRCLPDITINNTVSRWRLLTVADDQGFSDGERLGMYRGRAPFSPEMFLRFSGSISSSYGNKELERHGLATGDILNEFIVQPGIKFLPFRFLCVSPADMRLVGFDTPALNIERGSPNSYCIEYRNYTMYHGFKVLFSRSLPLFHCNDGLYDDDDHDPEWNNFPAGRVTSEIEFLGFGLGQIAGPSDDVDYINSLHGHVPDQF